MRARGEYQRSVRVPRRRASCGRSVMLRTCRSEPSSRRSVRLRISRVCVFSGFGRRGSQIKIAPLGAVTRRASASARWTAPASGSDESTSIRRTSPKRSSPKGRACASPARRLAPGARLRAVPTRSGERSMPQSSCVGCPCATRRSSHHPVPQPMSSTSGGRSEGSAAWAAPNASSRSAPLPGLRASQAAARRALVRVA